MWFKKPKKTDKELIEEITASIKRQTGGDPERGLSISLSVAANVMRDAMSAGVPQGAIIAAASALVTVVCGGCPCAECAKKRREAGSNVVDFPTNRKH